MLEIPDTVNRKTIPALISKLILELRDSGYTYKECADILNHNNLTTKNGLPFTWINIFKIVRNIRLNIKSVYNNG